MINIYNELEDSRKYPIFEYSKGINFKMLKDNKNVYYNHHNL